MLQVGFGSSLCARSETTLGELARKTVAANARNKFFIASSRLFVMIQFIELVRQPSGLTDPRFVKRGRSVAYAVFGKP
jgi:hypothetical protein